ncbi:MAG: hypothetical protein QF805_24915 [Pirellulaceae bacterium]|jgi:pimeloyl-ACP methyl ester carboxylesterase|nr:hypothetical protein [Pirellulaceae bacterium]
MFTTERLMLAFVLTAVALSLAEPVVALEIAASRRAVGPKAPTAFVPYKASHSLADSSTAITRVVFSIHSSGFDALQYFENARAAAAQVSGALPSTLIVAPQFFEQKAIPGAIPDGMLFWRVSPFRGSSRGGVGPDVKKVSISAFHVMDDWLVAISDPRQFPNLKEIVLVGHSGGGQFVQRYAMVGKYEPQSKVTIRFVVSAPSSYAYPSAERYNQRSKRFVVPGASVIQQCPKYNDWGYGLGTPYAYFSAVPAEQLAARYAKRNVFYLCGSRDNNPQDDTIGKSCGAMMQGRHRLERMQVFSAFMESKYGKSIGETHKFAVVRGVGHYGKGTMNSAAGLKAIFAPIR